jgi:hypothetical protein
MTNEEDQQPTDDRPDSLWKSSVIRPLIASAAYPIDSSERKISLSTRDEL